MEEIIKIINEVANKYRFEYVIIGDVASSVFGKPRMTVDVDIVINVERGNVEIIKEFEKRGFNKVSSKKIKQFLNGYPVKLEYKNGFSVGLRAASFEYDFEVLKRARRIKIFGVNVYVARIEDLIVYKIARFDDIDKADIKSLIFRTRKINRDYIEKAVLKLEKESEIKMEPIKGDKKRMKTSMKHGKMVLGSGWWRNGCVEVKR